MLGGMAAALRSRRTPRPRHIRQGAALLVLGLHLLGIGLSLRLGAWADRTPPPQQAPLAVHLIQLPALPLPAVPEAAANKAQRRDAPRPRPLLPAAPRQRPDDALQAITWPEVPNQPMAAAASAPEAGTPAAVATAPRPALNLALPRGASAPWRAARNPALDDPRSNLGKLTLEQKLADAMGGDGQWVEEPIDADHRRLKRGNTCIDLQRPRAAQLDPFNPAYRALPWVAGQPRRC
jgi:hypothetical protein